MKEVLAAMLDRGGYSRGLSSVGLGRCLEGGDLETGNCGVSNQPHEELCGILEQQEQVNACR